MGRVLEYAIPTLEANLEQANDENVQLRQQVERQREYIQYQQGQIIALQEQVEELQAQVQHTQNARNQENLLAAKERKANRQLLANLRTRLFNLGSAVPGMDMNELRRRLGTWDERIGMCFENENGFEGRKD